eukprot:1161378-Pelagomonas_calceolata.AAC.7
MIRLPSRDTEHGRQKLKQLKGNAYPTEGQPGFLPNPGLHLLGQICGNNLVRALALQVEADLGMPKAHFKGLAMLRGADEALAWGMAPAASD